MSIQIVPNLVDLSITSHGYPLVTRNGNTPNRRANSSTTKLFSNKQRHSYTSTSNMPLTIQGTSVQESVRMRLQKEENMSLLSRMVYRWQQFVTNQKLAWERNVMALWQRKYALLRKGMRKWISWTSTRKQQRWLQIAALRFYARYLYSMTFNALSCNVSLCRLARYWGGGRYELSSSRDESTEISVQRRAYLLQLLQRGVRYHQRHRRQVQILVAVSPLFMNVMRANLKLWGWQRWCDYCLHQTTMEVQERRREREFESLRLRKQAAQERAAAATLDAKREAIKKEHILHQKLAADAQMEAEIQARHQHQVQLLKAAESSARDNLMKVMVESEAQSRAQAIAIQMVQQEQQEMNAMLQARRIAVANLAVARKKETELVAAMKAEGEMLRQENKEEAARLDMMKQAHQQFREDKAKVEIGVDAGLGIEITEIVKNAKKTGINNEAKSIGEKHTAVDDITTTQTNIVLTEIDSAAVAASVETVEQPDSELAESVSIETIGDSDCEQAYMKSAPNMEELAKEETGVENVEDGGQKHSTDDSTIVCVGEDLLASLDLGNSSLVTDTNIEPVAKSSKHRNDHINAHEEKADQIHNETYEDEQYITQIQMANAFRRHVLCATTFAWWKACSSHKSALQQRVGMLSSTFVKTQSLSNKIHDDDHNNDGDNHEVDGANPGFEVIHQRFSSASVKADHHHVNNSESAGDQWNVNPSLPVSLNRLKLLLKDLSEQAEHANVIVSSKHVNNRVKRQKAQHNNDVRGIAAASADHNDDEDKGVMNQNHDEYNTDRGNNAKTTDRSSEGSAKVNVKALAEESIDESLIQSAGANLRKLQCRHYLKRWLCGIARRVKRTRDFRVGAVLNEDLRRKLADRSFLHWRRLARHKQRNRDRLALGEAHWMTIRAKKVVQHLREHAARTIHARNSLARMHRLKIQRQLKVVFFPWRQRTSAQALRRRQFVAKLKTFSEHMCTVAQADSFGRWVAWYHHRLVQHVATQRARKHFKQRILKKIMNSWQAVVVFLKKARQVAMQRANRHTDAILQEYLMEWVAWVNARFIYREKINAARAWRRARTFQWMWRRWMIVVAEAKQEKWRKQAALRYRKSLLQQAGVVHLVAAVRQLQRHRSATYVTHAINITQACLQRALQIGRNWRYKTVVSRWRRQEAIRKQQHQNLHDDDTASNDLQLTTTGSANVIIAAPLVESTICHANSLSQSQSLFFPASDEPLILSPGNINNDVVTSSSPILICGNDKDIGYAPVEHCHRNRYSLNDKKTFVIENHSKKLYAETMQNSVCLADSSSAARPIPRRPIELLLDRVSTRTMVASPEELLSTVKSKRIGHGTLSSVALTRLASEDTMTGKNAVAEGLNVDDDGDGDDDADNTMKTSLFFSTGGTPPLSNHKKCNNGQNSEHCAREPLSLVQSTRKNNSEDFGHMPHLNAGDIVRSGNKHAFFTSRNTEKNRNTIANTTQGVPNVENEPLKSRVTIRGSPLASVQNKHRENVGPNKYGDRIIETENVGNRNIEFNGQLRQDTIQDVEVEIERLAAELAECQTKQKLAKSTARRAAQLSRLLLKEDSQQKDAMMRIDVENDCGISDEVHQALVQELSVVEVDIKQMAKEKKQLKSRVKAIRARLVQLLTMVEKS